jgi:FKBP-type peptidyl-prolyl cis-trans isomerase SlyD
MKITPQSVVSLTWTLKDTLGETLDILDEPVEFLVGGNDLLHAIEHALFDHQAGDTVHIQLEPEHAFGDFDDQKIYLEPRSAFPADVQEGMVFEGLPAGCSGAAPQGQMLFVSEIYPEHVVLDGNHPLAGMAIRLDIKVHQVREATVEEIGQGTLGTSFFKLDNT